MEEQVKMILTKKKKWVAPQRKAYGNVQELTLTGPVNGQRPGGGHGPGPGGGRPPSHGKTCGCRDCCRSWS